MKTLINKVTTVIFILMVILSTQTNIYAHSNTNTIQLSNTTQDNKPSGYYGYYGIVQGNGHETTIFIKIANNWERYTINSDYVGYECKVISFDKKITTDNYKTLKVINIIETSNNHRVSNTIHDYMLFKVFKESAKEGK